LLLKVKVKIFLYRPWRPLALRVFENPIFSDIRLTDGAKVVSLTIRPLFTPRKIPGTHFWRGLVDPRAIVRLEGLGKLKSPPHPGLEPKIFQLVT
jgi:hypothetical protein